MPLIPKGKTYTMNSPEGDMPKKGGTYPNSGDSSRSNTKGKAKSMPAKMAPKSRNHEESVARPPDIKRSLDKNLAGTGVEQKNVDAKQKKKYASKAKQSKGSGAPRAKGMTKESKKERNLDSGTYF